MKKYMNPNESRHIKRSAVIFAIIGAFLCSVSYADAAGGAKPTKAASVSNTKAAPAARVKSGCKNVTLGGIQVCI